MKTLNSRFASAVSPIVLGLLLLPAGLVFGQVDDAEPIEQGAFSLFGSVEIEDSGDRQSQIRNTAGDRNPAEPEFTLVGTSRIGDRYSAILRHREGQEVRVTATEGRNTPVEGFPQYTVVDITSGRVSMQYPGGRPCVASSSEGVSCSGAANIASMELTYAEPVVRREPENNRESAAESIADFAGGTENTEEESAPENPFAQLRARALAEGANAPSPRTTPRGSFQPRRIDPSEVPPGFRIVSTPFGDRLVED